MAVFALKLFWADPTLGGSLEGLLIFAMAVLFILVLSQIGAQERAARMQMEHVLGALQHAHQELADSHRQLARYATQAADLATVPSGIGLHAKFTMAWATTSQECCATRESAGISH